jgi:hypothetical protein
MFSPLRSLLVAVSCLLVSVSISNAQNVTTWHNDPDRSGWQQHETFLNAIQRRHEWSIWPALAVDWCDRIRFCSAACGHT